jgi:hypothetical protein
VKVSCFDLVESCGGRRYIPERKEVLNFALAGTGRDTGNVDSGGRHGKSICSERRIGIRVINMNLLVVDETESDAMETRSDETRTTQE